METVYGSMRRQGLGRRRTGACSVASSPDWLSVSGMDAWLARVLFVAILMIIPESQIIIYPILWILMPSEARSPVTTGSLTEPGGQAAEQLTTADRVEDQDRQGGQHDRGQYGGNVDAVLALERPEGQRQVRCSGLWVRISGSRKPFQMPRPL